MSPASFLTSVFAPLRDLILPASCIRCGVLLGGEPGVCSECWQALDFLAGQSVCQRCAEPLPERYADPQTECARCKARPPHFDRAVAALVYDEAARGLVLGLKYGDRLHAVPVLARMMAGCAGPMVSNADVIVPVPVHAGRLRQRRFNQSAELARQISQHCGVPVSYALTRHRATRSQSGGRAARARNVADAFSVNNPHHFAGKAVVLVDDVLTTGATADACAAALKAAGAAHVSVLALARARGPDESGALPDLL